MFRIKAHDDYHEILAPKGWKAIELGCFPIKGNYAWKYLALYYKDGKPKSDTVMKRAIQRINANVVDPITKEMVDLDEFKSEIRQQCRTKGR